MAAILTHTTDLNYASSATLQLLEQELDELRRARQARRLSMLSGQSPSPPPQFKAARRNSDVPSRESTPERRKPPVKLKESISSPSIQTSVPDSIKEFEELPRNSFQTAGKPNISTEKFDPIEPSDDTALIINQVPVLVSPEKEECEDTAVLDTSEEEPLTPEVTIKEEESSSENYDLAKMHDDASTTAILEPAVTENKETKEESNPAEAVDQPEEETESVETLGEKSPVIKAVLPENKDGNNEKPTQPMASNLQSAEHKPRAIQRERKPFRIQTAFEQDQTHENQESAILLNAIRNLKSSAPSPPPATVALSPSKSTSALYKLTDKRALFQPSQLPSNDFGRKQRPNDRKPRPLSDAFIGVKGLSKRFDSTESFRSKEKPLLSPESQSVSRQRRISAPTKPAISALSQIFANNEAKPPVRPARQSKPLPPIKVDELAKKKQVKSIIPPQKNESLRLLHKTMPAIPIEATAGYPNPLPVYTPQLVHPIGEVMKEENTIDESKIPKESIDETKCHRKRVSFSTVVTTIPPPSPSQYSDDDSQESQRKQPAAIMSSAHLLSRWQQQHQMDRKMPTRGKNDTRGFWEAFSTEMNNRAAPDLRRIARDPPSQQMNSQSRFIPTTFGNKPLPAVSNDKPIQEASMRKNKTWINALQDRLAMKTSSETLNEAKAVQNSYRGSVASRKPVNQVSFTDSALPRSNTPPLHHPTKSRPKKPSSFRKHTLQSQRSNIVGSEVSVPPPAVQRPWYRNH